METLKHHLDGMHGVSNVAVRGTLVHLDYHNNYCCIDISSGKILALEVDTSLTISEMEQLVSIIKFIKEFPSE